MAVRDAHAVPPFVAAPRAAADPRSPAARASDASRRRVRDTAALLALPAMWVDRDPEEIATGLLSVLFSMLGLRSGSVRFDDPGTGPPIRAWRPAGPTVPAELQILSAGPEATATAWESAESADLRVTSVPVALPWGRGLVVVAAGRSGFPTAVESSLLAAAVVQAAIAIHTARRIALADGARLRAEAALVRRDEALRAVVQEVEPSLTRIAERVHAASRLVEEGGVTERGAVPREPTTTAGPAPSARSSARPLTRREGEVLELLAQGMSNKEIAGLMWLSHRTVERHVTSLYRKIGVARRSEATAFALRRTAV